MNVVVKACKLYMGSNPILTTMKQLIKQSIIGAIYMFMIAAMGAVVVVAMYAMAGR